VQIKDGTIQAKDLSKKTRAKLASTSAGERGPTGPKGDRGPAGERGPAGRDGRDGQDARANSIVRRAEAEVGPHQTAGAFAHCHSNEEAIGGGGEFAEIDGNEWIQRSTPATGNERSAEGSTADGWFVLGFNDENTSQTISAFAVCAATGTD
jgi:hypothetical protein